MIASRPSGRCSVLPIHRVRRIVYFLLVFTSAQHVDEYAVISAVLLVRRILFAIADFVDPLAHHVSCGRRVHSRARNLVETGDRYSKGRRGSASNDGHYRALPSFCGHSLDLVLTS